MKFNMIRTMTSFYFYISLIILGVETIKSDWNSTDNAYALNSTFDKGQNPSQVRFSRMWISQLLAEVEYKFEMESVNEKCKKDYQTYKVHVYDNQSIWAIRMLESTEWPSVGILAGVTHYLGHWSECLKVDGNGLKGRYCVVESVLELNFEEFCHHELTQSADQLPHDCLSWEFIKRSIHDKVLIPRNNLNWAMCIPSSCSSADLQTSLATALNPVFARNNLSLSVKVNPENCQIEEPFQPSTAYTYTKNFFFLLITYVIAATVIDVLLWENRDGACTDGWPAIILRSFSIRRTFKDLFNCSNFNNQNAICTIKFGLIYIVIAAHRVIYTSTFPIFQTEDMEKDLLVFGLHYLDIVFSISGFLMYEHCSKPMQKMGTRFFLFHVVYRYLRILSLLVLVLPFFTYIFPHIGEGPYWQSLSRADFAPCQSIWWRTVLLINNLPHPLGYCYATSWHFAADFQLSILGSFLLLIYTKNRKYGIMAFIATVALSTIAVSFTAHSMNFTGFQMSSYRYSKVEMWDLVDRIHFYTATYPRINSYLPGMAISMIIQTLKKKNYKFTLLQAVSIVVTAVSTIFLIEFYGIYVFKKAQLSLIDLVFGGLYKFCYVSSLGSVYCVCLVGITFSRINQKSEDEHGAKSKCSICSAVKKLVSGMVRGLQSVLKWNGFIPLSKLTFGATLVSNAFQQYHIYSLPSHFTYTSTLDFNMLTFSDVVSSFLLSFILYLIWECPVNLILKEIKRQIIRTSVQEKDS